MGVKILLAAALLVSPTILTAKEPGPPIPSQVGWHAQSLEGGCSLSYLEEGGERGFAYIRKRDGSYQLGVKGPALSPPADKATPLVLRFGDAEFTAGPNTDPVTIPSSTSEANLRLFTDGEFFEAGFAGATFERYPLLGISSAKVPFEECLRGLAVPSSAPELLEFTGLRKLTAVANRHRMLGETLQYRLVISPDGVPTDCELSRKFRSKAVTAAFCNVLMKYLSFRPAHDEQGVPVKGDYFGRVVLDMPIKAD